MNPVSDRRTALPAWALGRLAGGVEAVIRYFVGRDIFYSYSRASAFDYVTALAAAVESRMRDDARPRRLFGRVGVTWFCDTLSSEPTLEPTPRLNRHLRRSSLLVLVITNEAVRSRHVRQEVADFLLLDRPVVPIDVAEAQSTRYRNGVLRTVHYLQPWGSVLGAGAQTESSFRVSQGQPSEAVVARIVGALDFPRQEQRLRTAITVTVAAVATLLAGSGLYSYRMVSDANTRVEIASKEVVDASAARDIAREETRLQQRIGSSVRLAAEASRRVRTEPGLALALAAHAVDASPTGQARRAALDALTYTPQLETLVRGAHTGRIRSAAVSLDGEAMATRDERGETLLWNVRTRSFEQLVKPRAGEAATGEVAFSPSGDRLAVSQTLAGSGSIGVWNIRGTPGLVAALPVSGEHLAFVSEGLLAVESVPAGGGSRAVVFWELGASASATRLPSLAVEGELTALVADPALRLLVLRDAKRIRVCRVPCNERDVRQLKGKTKEGEPWDAATDTAPLPGVALSHEAEPRVAAAFGSGQIGIWSALSGQLLEQIPLPQPVPGLPANLPPTKSGIAFSADGRLLAFATSDGIAVKDLAGGNSSNPGPRSRNMTDFFNMVSMGFVAGDRLAVARPDGAVAFLDPAQWVAAARTFPYPAGLEKGVDRFASSANGSQVAIARDNQLWLWTPAKARARKLMEAESGTIAAVAITSDGQEIAAGRTAAGLRGASLVVCDASGRERVRRALTGRAPVQRLEFLGDAQHRMIGAVFEDGAIEVFDLTALAEGRPRVATKVGSPGGVAAFDPRGSLLATADASRAEVRVLNITTGAVDILSTGTASEALAFAADGGQLVGFDIAGTAWNWSPARPQAQAARLMLNTNRGRDPADASKSRTSSVLSADAALLAFVESGDIALWDVELGLQLNLPRVSSPGPPQRLAFSADGTRLLVFNDRSLTVVDVDAKVLAMHACRVAPRPIGPGEARDFRIEPLVPLVCR